MRPGRLRRQSATTNRCLLPSPRRIGGQRRYDDEDVRRVTFIRRCRDLDFSVEQVRSLVELTHDSDRSCLEARELAEIHLAAVRRSSSNWVRWKAARAANRGCERRLRWRSGAVRCA